MTIELPRKPTQLPTLYDVLGAFGNELFGRLHAIKVGTIKSFDAAKRTATVQIAFKQRLDDGSVQSVPVLLDVPVVTVRGGVCWLSLPITAGDECLVLFSDQSLDAWFLNGGEAEPMQQRKHDLSDGIALVGLNSQASPLVGTVPGEAGLILRGGAKLAETGGKITIRNTTSSLLTLVTGLVTVIEALQVEGPLGPLPLTSTSIAALEAYKLSLLDLLY